ncbi:division/cell wall cluster transcriptional repressor MraZ [Sphingobacterium sp. lm-10]|uniref:division/cell wall cluster transcriptional repressor MraZ n=1 Tax=Sphingobacterium sp. lm-10 TaxID=2944904 RepID=UPI00202297C9|nr:division/cell wall cluster transcriptional repressor MraZ [Sphingobacterium sp. lm-10]MCL7989137.1 division/cell wall cluster transcriptional repressor MraZ [Sphingobacterium sp. lm-10]
MTELTGEYICKLDAKGRMVVPALLKKQIPNIEQEGLIVNRGFEKNLVIYPRSEWSKMMKQLSRLNKFKAENRNFIRKFMSGATELTLDSANRVLLPKSLMEYAEISGELMLACQFDRIEVWSKSVYLETLGEMSEDDFATLGEKVMGGLDIGDLENE